MCEEEAVATDFLCFPLLLLLLSAQCLAIQNYLEIAQTTLDRCLLCLIRVCLIGGVLAFLPLGRIFLENACTFACNDSMTICCVWSRRAPTSEVTMFVLLREQIKTKILEICALARCSSHAEANHVKSPHCKAAKNPLLEVQYFANWQNFAQFIPSISTANV